VRFRPLRLVDAGVACAGLVGVGLVGVEAVVRSSARPPGTVLRALPRVLDAASGWASAAVPVWIPLSAAELGPGRLPDQLSAALLRSGMPPDAVVVRLRRSVGRTADDVPTALAALRARGIRTAVDVSAAGPLALLGLRELPADWIHLDPDLTHEVLTDPRLALVVEHTVALARGLGIAVLADGGDGHTTAWLTRRGCEVVAGESAALTTGQLTEWLHRADDAAVPD
jgi:EAL domain-containing protein (putative c-di-GMP-specific phosphodiesterase class I)